MGVGTYTKILTLVIFIPFLCSNVPCIHLSVLSKCLFIDINKISKIKKQKKDTNGAIDAFRVFLPIHSSLTFRFRWGFTLSVLRLETKQLLRGDDENLCHLASVLFQHTTVLPFILIEMRTSHHAYPSRSSGLTAICTFSVGYILW